MKPVIKLGLIGFGTVGTGVARILLGKTKPHLRGRGFDLALVRIADLDITTDRGIELPPGILTTDAQEILNDPAIDVVIELIGGYEPAKTFTLKAFENGKSVVTANKALIARHGHELFTAAAKANVSYLFEASVGGGIPIIRSLMDGLNANEIQAIYGILNGTTNYILTGMARDGREYGAMLAKAQEMGYAEADPTADVSGSDTLNKIAILSRLAFGIDFELEEIFCEGITRITIEDIKYAHDLGYAIKLLAIAKRHGDGRVEIRVHPTFVSLDAIIAWVDDEFNAIEVYGDAVGRELFYGKGAGMMPTGSAMVSDIVYAASDIVTFAPTNVSRMIVPDDGPSLVPIGELKMRYYLRLMVKDQPGVLAKIAAVFAGRRISIESVIQKAVSQGVSVPLIIMTHEAREGDIQEAMKQFAKLDPVAGDVQLIRVEPV